MMKEVSIEEMWEVIERYGVNRAVFEESHPTEQDVAILYHLIIEKNSRERKR